MAENKVKMVKVKLPKMGKENPDVFISINNENWHIKRGVWVEVPDYVETLLANQEKMETEAEEFAEGYEV